MGRFMLNGKATMLNGNFIEYNNGIIELVVRGTHFAFSNYEPPNPIVTNFNNSSISFNSSESNSATIDYGDGNIINYTFKSNRMEFRPSIPLGDSIRQEIHTYTDGNSDERVVRISFAKPDKITSLESVYCPFYRAFPSEISSLTGLNYVALYQSNLNSFPVSIANLKKLTSLNLSNIGTAISLRIPDEFIDLSLVNLLLEGSVNLSDAITSNLVKFLNSPKRDTLVFLNIAKCGITSVPNEFNNLTKLKQLSIDTNETEFPYANMEDVTLLEHISISTLKLLSFGDMSIYNKLKTFVVVCPNISTSIPTGLENAVDLKTYNFYLSYQTTARINSFITNFYNFINTNASKTGLNTLPFRGMTVNCTSGAGNAPTGTFQSPTGYVAGSNNGTPASPKEMLWVLINQYGHTITYTA